MSKISSRSLLEVITRESNNNGSEFTIKSMRTGKDYTYKISRSEFKGKWYTHVKVEREYLKFVRLGTYYNGKIFNKGIVVDTPSSVAIGWVLDNVEKGLFDTLDTLVEVRHTGNCLVCGRKLTDTQSLEVGLGPICRNGI